MTTVLETALTLAAAGHSVFPLKYQTKEPATRCGFYDATSNPATIRRWFGGSFKYNLGMCTGQASGVWIFDEDNADSLKALIEKHGPLPDTKQSQSYRGSHHWFKTTPVPIPCSTGRVGPGLDIKAEAGYVVVPPSIHPDGPAYRWLNDLPIVEAPSWLLVLARKPTSAQQTPTPKSDAPRSGAARPGTYGAAAHREETEILSAMPKDSGRNNQLNKSAFSLSQLVAGGELSAGDVERGLARGCPGKWSAGRRRRTAMPGNHPVGRARRHGAPSFEEAGHDRIIRLSGRKG